MYGEVIIYVCVDEDDRYDYDDDYVRYVGGVMICQKIEFEFDEVLLISNNQ